MAVLTVHTIAIVLPSLRLPCLFVRQSQCMAPAASFLSLNEGLGLSVGVGHGLEGHEAFGMFPRKILLDLRDMTGATGLNRGELRLVHIIIRRVGYTMTEFASHGFGHFATIEIFDLQRGDFDMTLFARRCFGPGRGDASPKAGRQKNRHDNTPTLSVPHLLPSFFKGLYLHGSRFHERSGRIRTSAGRIVMWQKRDRKAWSFDRFTQFSQIPAGALFVTGE